MRKTKISITIILILGILIAGTACLQPNRFELDADSPDGLLTLGFVIVANPLLITTNFGTTTLNVREGDTAQTYTVRLSLQPTADVLVTPATSSLLTISPLSLTFTSENWNTAQTVTATAVDNQTRAGADANVNLGHTMTSTDSRYNNLTANLTVTVQDNEKILFVTGQTYIALSLGGISGADAICNAHADRPDTSKTYKAMLVGNTGSAVGRRACINGECGCGIACSTNEGVDWVLTANTGYVQKNTTTYIGTTNAAAIFHPFPTTASIGAVTVAVWTGIDNAWRTASNGHCEVGGTSWSGDDGNAPIRGLSNSSTATMLFQGGTACGGVTGALYCAEQ